VVSAILTKQVRKYSDGPRISRFQARYHFYLARVLTDSDFSLTEVKYGAFGNSFPIIPGHEVVGEVVAVPESEEKWKIGVSGALRSAGYHLMRLGLGWWCLAWWPLWELQSLPPWTLPDV
jgi:hypothetical protein